MLFDVHGDHMAQQCVLLGTVDETGCAVAASRTGDLKQLEGQRIERGGRTHTFA